MSTPNWIQLANDIDINVRNFINGQYVDIAAGDRLIDKYSPRDGSLLYQFGSGSIDDVNLAVANSQAAFLDGPWSTLALSQRQAVLHKLADLVEENKEELALLDCLDVGKPISHALGGDIAMTIDYLRSNADLADKLLSPCSADDGVLSYLLRKPIGVVGAIIGWNYPLAMAAVKVAPALVMGNSIVLKPSEFTSLSACRLAELAVEAGVPAGVFNVVHGAGKTVGAAISHHPDVGMLSFTGSSATGKQMLVAAGESNMKRLVLECGGKSPYIVFDDCPADLEFMASDIVATAFPNQGAMCASGTRLLIHESLAEKLLPMIVAETEKLMPEDPLNPSTSFGAIVNEGHLNKILSYIENGQEEGATLLYGGKRQHLGDVGTDASGYYIQPAIFVDVNPEQRIAQEEIFGPVLSVFTFKDEAEAIALANNSHFGLAAYAATTSLSRSQRLAQKLNAGITMIVGTSVPCGGGCADLGKAPHRESGFGVEGGLEGLAAYTVSSVIYQYG